MKKVLLITLQGDNYGNRLQNYALQTVLKELNCEIYTPYYDAVEFENLALKVKFVIKAFFGCVGLKKWRKEYIRCRRIIKFNHFNSKYIDNRFKVNYSNVFKKYWDEFDFAISGSDQVWHKWSSSHKELEFFYMLFMDKSKRIAYAPSFGFSEFPNEDIAIHRKGLSEITYLSCREKSGAELIRNLVNRKTEVVLDPTLLLGAEEWTGFERKPKGIGVRDYIVVYFLGDNKVDGEIRKFANERKLHVIDLNNKIDLESQLALPEEFVWLIHHAKFVFTDSFHACVFSLIFRRKFLVFKRSGIGCENMFNRIEDILDIFGVADRVFKGDFDVILKEYAPKSISAHKKKSLQFIEQAIN